MCPFDELGLPEKWKCHCSIRDKHNKRIHECLPLKGRHLVIDYYGNVLKVI